MPVPRRSTMSGFSLRSLARARAPLSPTASMRSCQARRYVASALNTSANIKVSRRTSLIAVRYRSAWSGCGPRGARWGWRMRGAGHRPECKWVASEEDPSRAPRDKECPACQHDEKMNFEWSARELLWQRHIAQMHNMMEKDPYEAIFGWSNRRLKGHWDWSQGLTNSWVRREARNSSEPAPEESFRMGSSSANGAGSTPPEAEASGAKEKPQKSSENSAPANEQAASFHPLREIRISRSASYDSSSANGTASPVQAAAQWSVSGINETGEGYRDSGKFVFDPVTLRMVPVNESEKVAQASSDPAQVETKPAEQKSDNTTSNSKIIYPEIKRFSDRPRRRRTPMYDHNGPLEPSGQDNTPAPAPATLPTPEADKIAQESAAEGHVRSKMSNKAAFEQAWENDKQITDADAGVESVNPNWPLKATYPQRALSPITQRWADDDLYWRDPSHEKRWAWYCYMRAETHVSREMTTPCLTPANEMSRHLRALKYMRDRWPETFKILPEYFQCHIPPESSDRLSETKGMTNTYFNQYNALKSIFRKDKPLHHMRPDELAKHQARMRQLAKGNKAISAEDSKAAAHLDKEVAQQKAAMYAFENKWWSRTNSHLAESASRSKSGKDDISKGEGDMCENVVKFVDPDRWYKKQSTSAPANHQQRFQDRELVRSIREVYEDAYGIIDVGHRQPGRLVNERTLEDESKSAAPEALENPQTKSTIQAEASASSSPPERLHDVMSAPQEDRRRMLDFFGPRSKFPSHRSQPMADEAKASDPFFTYQTYTFNPRSGTVVLHTEAEKPSDLLNKPISVASALEKLENPHPFATRLLDEKKLETKAFRVTPNSITLRSLKIPNRNNADRKIVESIPPKPALDSHPKVVPAPTSAGPKKPVPLQPALDRMPKIVPEVQSPPSAHTIPESPVPQVPVSKPQENRTVNPIDGTGAKSAFSKPQQSGAFTSTGSAVHTSFNAVRTHQPHDSAVPLSQAPPEPPSGNNNSSGNNNPGHSHRRVSRLEQVFSGRRRHGRGSRRRPFPIRILRKLIRMTTRMLAFGAIVAVCTYGTGAAIERRRAREAAIASNAVADADAHAKAKGNENRHESPRVFVAPIRDPTPLQQHQMNIERRHHAAKTDAQRRYEERVARLEQEAWDAREREEFRKAVTGGIEMSAAVGVGYLLMRWLFGR